MLVTGGSGLLGAALVHPLVKEGIEKAVVLDINPAPKRLDGIIDPVEFVVGDVGDPEVLLSFISQVRPEKLYHFAAYLAKPCERTPGSRPHSC